VRPPDRLRADQARARAAVLLLGPMAAVGLAGFLASNVGNRQGADLGTFLALGAILAVLLGAWLAHRGHGVAGALLAVAAMEAAIWGLHRGTVPHPDTTLDFLAVPLLVAGVTLPPAWAAGVTAATLALVPPLQAAVRQEPLPDALHASLTLLILLGLIAVVAVVAAIVQDRTLRALERHAAQVQASSRALARASDDRIHMLQQLAHDLATPLTPVRLQLAVLRQKVPATPDARASFDMLDRNVAHLARLVDDVRQVGLLAGGGLRLRAVDLDLAMLVRQAVESLEPAARARGVRLEASAPGPLPVRAEAAQVTRVLYNLVGNALKFTPPGGRVQVRATAVGPHAEVAVADSGPGLDAQQLARLFAAFTQVHDPDSLRAEDRGTGLGLYISKGIVEAHGGTLAASSAGPGQGSTFTFRLPLAAAT